jgi:hypothetical protein
MYLRVSWFETFTNKTKTGSRNLYNKHQVKTLSVTVHPVIFMSLSYKSTTSPSVVSKSSSVKSVTCQISVSSVVPSWSSCSSRPVESSSWRLPTVPSCWLCCRGGYEEASVRYLRKQRPSHRLMLVVSWGSLVRDTSLMTLPLLPLRLIGTTQQSPTSRRSNLASPIPTKISFWTVVLLNIVQFPTNISVKDTGKYRKLVLTNGICIMDRVVPLAGFHLHQ